MTVKLDVSKTYDRVEWEFLEKIMLRLGFPMQWVNFAMLTEWTASYSIIINGEPCGYVSLSRGIKQGDPLSSYLFLFCARGSPPCNEGRLKLIIWEDFFLVRVGCTSLTFSSLTIACYFVKPKWKNVIVCWMCSPSIKTLQGRLLIAKRPLSSLAETLAKRFKKTFGPCSVHR